MNKELLAKIVAVAGAIFIGIVTNTISEVNDHFKSELRYMGLLADLEEAQNSPVQPQAIEKDELTTLVGQLDSLSNEGLALLICNNDSDEPDLLGLSRLASLNRLSKVKLLDNYTFEDARTVFNVNPNLNYLLVLQPSMISSKPTQQFLNQSQEFNADGLISVSLKFNIWVHSREFNLPKLYEVTEYGIGGSQDFALQDAKDRLFKYFE